MLAPGVLDILELTHGLRCSPPVISFRPRLLVEGLRNMILIVHSMSVAVAGSHFLFTTRSTAYAVGD
jgi:hypothetical protein